MRFGNFSNFMGGDLHGRRINEKEKLIVGNINTDMVIFDIDLEKLIFGTFFFFF